MLVFDKYGFTRKYENGKCLCCSRYNTSEAWCRTCDPQQATQGWTSGNNDIDDCIKEFQLNAIDYEDVIEWIPFNRLDNIQKVGGIFSAIWIDGIRSLDRSYYEGHTHSRTPSYRVKLKILSDTHNSLDFLEKFKDYLKLHKLEEVKVYGLTQDTETNEYMIILDEFYFERCEVDCGKCVNCGRYNTSLAWCKTCDPYKTTQGWTSGNDDIDDFIKEFQLNSECYEDVIEWIPFNRLDNVKKIGKGGFGTVFSATWLDGKREILVGSFTPIRSRTSSHVVALKTLPSPQKNFLREFKNYMNLRLVCHNLELYGLTQNTNNEYLMVFQYANKESLHKFLLSNFRELNWKSKLKQLVEISRILKKVHEAEHIHKDLHSGNILQNQYINGDIISYIADLGLSREKDESDLEDGIYGVLPYVAPEVLNKQSYTIAADIYSFGIIMTEMSTGKPPHYGVEFDEALAIQICNGLRPEFAKGTPECYIQLANQCMDANPSKRPPTSYIYDELSKCKDELPILEAFESADAIIPTLSTELPICSKDKLTSKLLNFNNLSKPINSSLFRLQNR